MVRALWLAVALALLAPALAHAETPAEYRSAVADALRAAESATVSVPFDRPLTEDRRFALALATMEQMRSVAIGDGRSMPVDNSALARRLGGSRGEARAAIADLRLIAAALDRAAERPDTGRGEEAKTVLEKVLADPTFRPAEQGSLAQRLGELLRPVERWLRELLSRLGLNLDWGDGFGSVAVWPLYVLAIGALVFVVRSWHRAWERPARSALLAAGRVKAVDEKEAAHRAAKAAADSGDYRVAIHFLYVWAVLVLGERSRLPRDPSLTNREQLSRLQGSAEEGALLAQAVDAFDRLWYGHAACTGVEHDRFKGLVERLVAVGV